MSASKDETWIITNTVNNSVLSYTVRLYEFLLLQMTIRRISVMKIRKRHFCSQKTKTKTIVSSQFGFLDFDVYNQFEIYRYQFYNWSIFHFNYSLIKTFAKVVIVLNIYLLWKLYFSSNNVSPYPHGSMGEGVYQRPALPALELDIQKRLSLMFRGWSLIFWSFWVWYSRAGGLIFSNFWALIYRAAAVWYSASNK